MRKKTIIIGLLIWLFNLWAGYQKSDAHDIRGRRALKGNAFTRNTTDKIPRPSFRVNVNLTVVRAHVVDSKNRCVGGLEREYFHLYEDKVEQKIVQFNEETAPVSVGIIFDISGSMKDHFLPAKKSILQFLEDGDGEDEFFLITFNNKVTLDADFTNRKPDIQNHVAFRTPGGRTALYDAVYMGLEKIREAQHSKKALIVITDGEDNSSRYSFNEVKTLAQETDVQIYAIVQQGGLGYGQPIIERLVKLTGGRCFTPYSFDALETYVRQIHSELRKYYVLGYHSTNQSQNGQWRRIKIKLELPEGLSKLNVRAREGYYAQKR